MISVFASGAQYGGRSYVTPMVNLLFFLGFYGWCSDILLPQHDRVMLPGLPEDCCHDTPYVPIGCVFIFIHFTLIWDLLWFLLWPMRYVYTCHFASKYYLGNFPDLFNSFLIQFAVARGHSLNVFNFFKSYGSIECGLSCWMAHICLKRLSIALLPQEECFININ